MKPLCVSVQERTKSLRQMMSNNYKLIIALVTPALFSILPIVIGGKPIRCAFVLILMSVYWLSECIPMAITSLLPVLLYPLFGIMDSRSTSKIYFEDICMMSFGALTLAIAIEKTNLHKKIAIKFLMFLGSNPVLLLLGMMSITGFISLWISNTATTSMMLPIVIEIAKQLILAKKKMFENKLPLKQFKGKKKNALDKIVIIQIEENQKNDVNMNVNEKKEAEIDLKHDEENEEIFNTKKAKRLMTGFCISITYAASIGGTGSLVGTSTNLVLKGYYDLHYPKAGLSFLTFMLFTIPSTLVMMLLAWLWLSFLWLPRESLLEFFKFCKKKSKKNNNELRKKLQENYEKCGHISWDQASVAIFFFILASLWLTRDLYFVPGWGALFEKGYVSDTTPAILILFLLIIWPKDNIFKGHKYEHLMQWKTIASSYPWHILFLSGGGLALAQGFQESHLSDILGQTLTNIVPKNANLMLIVVTIFSQMGTELTSNVSMESILLPIIDSLAQENGINPSFLLLPISISVSFAFLLPVATPTNAIVFASNYVRIKDMVISGIVLKVIGLLVVLMDANMMIGVLFSNQLNITINSTNTVRNASAFSFNQELI